MDPITARLRVHYGQAFARHGGTSEGIGWGPHPERVARRYENMLAVLERGDDARGAPTLLDVGCGYGGLLEHARRRAIALEYTGMDVVPEMVEYAGVAHDGARFLCQDFLHAGLERAFDYVVCNGVLTLKLAETEEADMRRFAERTIAALFRACRRGAAFNLMTTRVDYRDAALFYRDPAEVLAHCLALTPHVRLDHARGLFEYTVYLYRNPRCG